MTGVHVYDPSAGREYRHPGMIDDTPSHDRNIVFRDAYTGESVWALPGRDLTIGGLLLAEIPPTLTPNGVVRY